MTSSPTQSYSPLSTAAAESGGVLSGVLATSWNEDDDGQYSFAEAMEDHMPCYDESLYYACKEYVKLHALYYKQLKRSKKPEEVPLRYTLLTLWTRPLATLAGQIYFGFQCLLVVASITQLVLETIPKYSAEVYPHMQKYWDAVEIPTALFFFLDIVVHMVLLPPVPNDFSRHSRRTYIRKFEFWVDVMTIVPTVVAYFALVVPSIPQVDFLKALRILRFTKVLRQFHAVDQLAFTLEKSGKPLLGPFVFLFGTLVTMSGAVFYLERGDYDPETRTFLIDDYDCLMSAPRALNPDFPCPKILSPFLSLPHTLWFCLVTITTVGYGDMVPHTTLGRACATICILCGNVLTAMPIAIVGTYFTDIVTTNRLRQAGDATKAFGRRGLVGAAAGAASLPLGGSGSTTAAELSGGGGATLTAGERLLELLAANGTPIDLHEPQGVALHQINAFVRHEFDQLVQMLSRVESVQRVKAARLRAVAPLCLTCVSRPTSASFAGAAGVGPSLSLARPMPFVVGSVGGALRIVPFAENPRALPAVLFTAVTATAPPFTLTIRPVFPAVIFVNGVRATYDAPTRLLVGDTIAIHQSPHSPPLVTYNYSKIEPDVPLTIGKDRRGGATHEGCDQPAPPIPAADGTPALKSTGTITLRSVPAPRDHRGLTFAAFAAAPGRMPFDDL